MTDPLITIVTPSLNQGRFIRHTIESILSQDYPRLEYIIMDGGSTDDTPEIAKEYGKRLRWISGPDRGQTHAINKGFRMAAGKIVSWVNADDFLLPGAVSAVAEAFQRGPELGAVYGDGYVTNIDGRILWQFPRPGPIHLWRLIHASDYLFQPAVFFRKTIFEKIGYLDEALHWAMDWDLFIRIAKRYPMAYLPKNLACQREYQETKTSTGGHKRFRELVRIMRRHGRLRFPPAYFAYGLDTYEKVLHGAIRKSTPWFLRKYSARIERLVTLTCLWLHERLCLRREGWYGDGWAGRSARLLLRPEGDAVTIRGLLPESHRALLRGQSLKVLCNGRTLFAHRLPFGEFEVTVTVRPDPKDSLIDLELRASRQFVPKRDEQPSADPRRLAYLLKSVEWVRTPVPVDTPT